MVRPASANVALDRSREPARSSSATAGDSPVMVMPRPVGRSRSRRRSRRGRAQPLVGHRREVAGAEREDQVAGAGEARDVLDEVGARCGR